MASLVILSFLRFNKKNLDISFSLFPCMCDEMIRLISILEAGLSVQCR